MFEFKGNSTKIEENKSKIESILPKKQKQNSHYMKLIYGKKKNENENKNENKKEISIFGSKFKENNRKKLILIIKNKKCDLNEKISIEIKDNDHKIKTKFLDNIINLDSMFEGCTFLLKISNFNNIKKLKSMKKLFFGCL